jgi:outer membrane protein, heavy metal efflux system
VGAEARSKRLWIVFAMLAAVPGRSAGDSFTALAPGAVTLADSKRIAFERNWDLLAAKSDVDVNVAHEVAAHEFPNPTLAWSTAKIPVDGTSAGTQHGNGLWERSYDTVVAVNQLLEIGGKRSARKDAAGAGREAAKAQFADAARLLEEAVTKAYVGALAAEDNGKILGQSAESLRKEAEIAHVRFKAGDISQADEARLLIAADRLELQAHQASASAVTARIELETLMAVPSPKGDIVLGDSLADSLERSSASTLPPAGEMLPEARPDVRAAQSLVQKATFELNLERAKRIPDPTLLGQYEHEPPDQPNTIGLGVSLPLPLWNWNTGAVLAALAAREQAERQLEKARERMMADVATARQAYDEAALRWQRQRADVAPRSAAILQTVRFAYKRGAASLVDLLQAERDDNDVRLATVQAAADAATALASLRSAFGIADEWPRLP